MITTLDELRDQVADGAQLDYLMFWGHRPPRSGGVGASCLSQWWPAEFTIDAVGYRTAEHYMMAEKARVFGDEASVAAVLAAATSKEAKELGRGVAGFDSARWAERRYDVVVRGNSAKFGQNLELREYLLGTGDLVIVEASPLDPVWGIGLAAEDERAAQPASWKGQNLLGFALMEVRRLLAEGEPPRR